MMPYGFKVEVWGDYALFSRPEMKAERVTYDVITPSAARGLLESVYWHPGLQWYIDRIYVLNKIKFANIRRNEGKSKASARNMKTAMDKKAYFRALPGIERDKVLFPDDSGNFLDLLNN